MAQIPIKHTLPVIGHFRITAGISAGYEITLQIKMEPEAKSCKLQNFYDAQSCTLAIICILIGAVVCFFGKSEYYQY